MSNKKKGTPPKNRGAKARRSAGKSNRTQDLHEVEAKIKKANAEINKIVGKLREYEAQIQEITTALFEKVGIKVEVEALETQLRLARNRAQEKVNVHRAAAQELQSVHKFLVDKMTGEGPEPPSAPKLSAVGTPEEDEDSDKSEDGESSVPPAPDF